MAKYKKRPDGRYETTRTDPITKRRVHFYGKSIREVDTQILNYSSTSTQKRSFSDVATEWKGTHFESLTHNSIKSYSPAHARALGEFAHRPIASIKPQDIKRFISDFSRQGYARKTVTNQLLVVSLIFSHAVQCGDIDVSPCDHIKVPSNLPKSKRDAASPEDEARIKNSDWLLPFFFLYTGLRRGEALALTWDDIDFDRNMISVTKSVYHISNNPHIKPPKTDTGVRTVPLLAPLRERLMKIQNQKGYLFHTASNIRAPMKNMEYTRQWQRYCEDTGVTCTAHQLRHSFATMLFEFGIQLKDAQDLLGHSTAAMTQDIYTHLRAGRKETVAQQINAKLVMSSTSRQRA